MAEIPAEIRDKKQWTYSFSATERRRPKHWHYKPNGGMTYAQATATVERLGPDYNFGFYVTHEDPYLIGDIDKVKDPNNPFKDMPPELAFLLKTKKTYSEISPSGRGVRYFFKFMSKEIKGTLSGQYYTSKEVDKTEKNRFQLNIGTPWMRMTGKPTVFSSETIAIVSVDEIAKCFKVKYKSNELVRTVSTSGKVVVPPIAKIQNDLMSLPMDQNPRIKRAYLKTFESVYDHYLYWMNVMMAVHDYSTHVPGSDIQCLQLFLNWSKNDTESFVSEEDVLRHWRSLDSNKDNRISFKSLTGLAYYNSIHWPIPRKQTQEEIDIGFRKMPMISEYANFKALVDFYDIKLHREEDNLNKIYITGDRDIIESNFMLYKVELHFDKYYGPFDTKTLISGFHMFAQRNDFIGMTHLKAKEGLRNLLAETRNTVDFVKMYFDTPFEDLPVDYQENKQHYDESTFENLFDCIEIDPLTGNPDKEKELYWRCYKCWLMGFTRSLYYENGKDLYNPKKMNNCILVLTSVEQRHKTSHFMNMLPSFMKDKIAITPHGFDNESSIKALYKLAASNLILVLDEIEKNLNSQTESNLKQLIDSNPQKIIDKWEVVESTIKPRALYAATSNQRTLRLGNEGSRRIFHIPVKSIDIDRMSKLCWHRIINDLKDEMFLGLAQGRLPWLLTEEELQRQANLHSRIRTKNNLDLILEEIYDFDSELTYSSAGSLNGVTSFQHDKTGTLKATTVIIKDMVSHGHDRFNIKQVALKRSLERLCGTYTKTERKPRSLNQPQCTIYKGLATQGRLSYWVMPPLKCELAKAAFSDILNLT